MKLDLMLVGVLQAVLVLCQITVADSMTATQLSTKLSSFAESMPRDLLVERMELMPLAFTENKGQRNKSVKFRVTDGGATIWFTQDGTYYQFTRSIRRDSPAINDPTRMLHESRDHEPASVEQLVIKASFLDANPNVEIVGEGLMEYRCNYLVGDDSEKWRTDW